MLILICCGVLLLMEKGNGKFMIGYVDVMMARRII
jgi:hypothetical protein